MQSSKFSIVVVCFNENPESIKFTLDSIFSQKYEFKEVILIDGGSESYTISELKKYSSLFSYFVSEPDLGIYDAMNKALQYVKGDWVIFMNIGDSFFDTKSIVSAASFIEKQKADIYCGITRVNNRDIVPPKKLTEYFLFRNSLCHQSMIVNLKLFNLIGNFDLKYTIAADREWTYRAIKGNLRYARMDFIISNWVNGGRSGNYKILNKELKYFKTANYSKVYNIMYASFEVVILIFKRVLKLNFTKPKRFFY